MGLIGTAFIHTDYSVPVEVAPEVHRDREGLAKFWDGKVVVFPG